MQFNSRLHKILSLLLLIFLVVGVSIGCAGYMVKEKEEKTPSPAKVVVTDGLGRQVEVPAKIERVVTNYGIATHFLFVLGVQDKLVGIDVPTKNKPGAFHLKLLPDFANLPAVGSPKEVNVEEILKLNPDLVLVAGRNAKLIEQLEERGLTVFGVVAETPEQLMNTMENLGKCFGKEERASKFNQYYHQMLSKISQKTKDIASSARPKVYVVGPSGPFSTAAGDMYQTSLIEMAGGENVAGDIKGGWVNVDMEQIMKWNPDFILVVKYGNTTPETILQDPRWKEIKAVKDGKVIWFPAPLDISWDYPSPQACLGLVWLAKTLHPELFPDLNPLKEADEFYKEFYGRSFTDLGGKL